MAVVPSSSRGASSGVSTVAATDASIVVAGTASAPTIATASLATIASLHASAGAIVANGQKITGLGTGTAATDAASLSNTVAQLAAPAAALAMNAQKITGLANGTVATDAAAFGQITAANAAAVALSTVTATGDLIVATGSATVTRLAAGTTSQVPFIIGGTPTYKTRATFKSTPADPTGTASGGFVMMGLGGAASITPVATGNLSFAIQGECSNTTALFGGFFKLKIGTGTAPINGAGDTGTDATTGVNVLIAANNLKTPFVAINVAVTGLALNTACWLDLSIAASGGGTFSVGNLTISAIEV